MLLNLLPPSHALQEYAVKEVDIQKLSLRCGADQECLVRWIARLEYEVRNQLKLSGHPGVVTVHDAFVHRGHFYIVMDFVRGTDLGRRLQRRGRLSEDAGALGGTLSRARRGPSKSASAVGAPAFARHSLRQRPARVYLCGAGAARMGRQEKGAGSWCAAGRDTRQQTPGVRDHVVSES